MSPVISQLLALAAVLYALPYRVIVRPLIRQHAAGLAVRWDVIRVLRVFFVVFLVGGGGWLAHLIYQAKSSGPTIWTLPHGVCAIALMLLGLVFGLIAEHLVQDHADEKFTTDRMDHVHNGPAGHEMDVV
jgi:uncharacterized membrane protein YeaQ/YmgE (transglycosylase-associated protein family)